MRAASERKREFNTVYTEKTKEGLSSAKLLNTKMSVDELHKLLGEGRFHISLHHYIEDFEEDDRAWIKKVRTVLRVTKRRSRS